MSFYVFFSFLFQNRNPFLCLQRPKRATPEVMTHLHTDEYINFLSKVTHDNVRRLTYQGSRFLIGEDNPPFGGVFEFSSISAGGSIGTLVPFLSSPISAI